MLMSKYAHVPNARGEVGRVEAARRDKSPRCANLDFCDGSCDGWRLNGRRKELHEQKVGAGGSQSRCCEKSRQRKLVFWTWRARAVS